MSGRVWKCEMIVVRRNKSIWTDCTATLYRYNLYDLYMQDIGSVYTGLDQD